MVADRLGPDVLDLHLHQHRGDQDAGLDVRADGDHGAIELVDAEFAQRVEIGAVGGNHPREMTGQALHQLGRLIDGQHLDTATSQLQRDRTSEAPQPDHHNRFLVDVSQH